MFSAIAPGLTAIGSRTLDPSSVWVHPSRRSDMSFDGIRGYVQFATGIGDATRARAAEVALSLIHI